MAELKDEPAKLQQTNVLNNVELSEKLIDENGDLMNENNVDRMKSSISVVQEIAQKRNLPIRFMVENETGPAHMKHFVIKCTVGDIEVSYLQSNTNLGVESFIFVKFNKFNLFLEYNRRLAMGIQKNWLKNVPLKIC